MGILNKITVSVHNNSVECAKKRPMLRAVPVTRRKAFLLEKKLRYAFSTKLGCVKRDV